eukprot:evm.model.scf_111.4 EVM.evm.TU.scf_111.4   scf_111:58146-58840(+)
MTDFEELIGQNHQAAGAAALPKDVWECKGVVDLTFAHDVLAVQLPDLLEHLAHCDNTDSRQCCPTA